MQAAVMVMRAMRTYDSMSLLHLIHVGGWAQQQGEEEAGGSGEGDELHLIKDMLSPDKLQRQKIGGEGGRIG